MSGSRVAVLQSNYIPWRGYFDLLGSVDQFVIYDIVQFTKRDWRNRNQIKTSAGAQWLTIPVATAGHFQQSIAETQISDPTWATRHWRSLERAYARAPHFDRYRDRFADAYRACGDMASLSAVNRFWIDLVAGELQITTQITDAAQYEPAGDPTDRLVALCRALGATTYLSGPSARAYLSEARFHEHGIAVEYMDYSSYRPYPQLHGEFVPAVSVLDLLFNLGPDARAHLQCGARAAMSTRMPVME